MSEKQTITGRITIDSDDEGLLAVLKFTPDDGGREWDLKAVNRFITEHKIVHGLDRKKVDDALSELLSSGAEKEFTLAEGDPPEKAVPEERSWSEISVPDEHREDVERVLRNAPPPEIFTTEIEKVKKEKLVKKKGLLSFGKEKEEKVVETVKVEKKRKVDIIPDVIEAGWVEAGAVVAEISPGRPGKTGKDVFGKIIPAPSADDEFWAGRGIEKKGGKLTAGEGGILRRGWNWVEVLPFRHHDWSLDLSRDKNTCLLTFNPGGAGSTPPDPDEILKRAGMLGCPEETLFSRERIKEIIDTAISAGKALEGVIISTDDDASFEIKVSEDRLRAEMVMHKGRGEGRPLVLKQAGAAIKSSGLKGLDLKKIQEIILEFYRGPETDTVFTLAEGEAPQHGELGEISWDLEFLPEKRCDEITKRSALLDDMYLKGIDSAANYPPAEASALAFVKAGQQIAALPVDSGKNGKDVFGEVVESSAADTSAYEALENVEFKNGIIVSTSDGVLERFDREGTTAFRVRPYRDSSFEVKLGEDRMSATLSAVPAAGGGNPPSAEDAGRVLEQAGVTAGIDSGALTSVIEKVRDGEEIRGALVAMGKAPKNAGEYKLKFIAELAGGEAVTIDKSGRADFRKQNKISSIREGEILAEIRVLEGDSEDGWDISGKTLPAKQLAPLNLEIGSNIREDKDDEGNIFLVAEKSGRIIYENNKIEVQESLFIKGDVDFGTGNIKFGGDVNVKGNIKSGFYIMAGGDVNVGMNSEMSLLSSDKTITVAQGVKGGGKAILRAKDSIKLSFAERATLLAVENISVKNAVFNCKVKCNGKLRLISEKGYLVGGVIQSRHGVEAANIGSLSGSRTEVSFGQDYLIADQIEIEEKQIEKIKKRLVKLESEMKIAEKSGNSKAVGGFRHEKVKLMKIMEKRSLRVFTLKERFETHHPGDVVVRGDVFPGVVFESHGRHLEISRKQTAVKIVFNQKTGVLETVPLQDKKDSTEKE